MIHLRQAFWVILISLVVNAANAATYYISSADGVDTNLRDGSINQPWKTIYYSFYRGGIGNTTVFKPGVYPFFTVPLSVKGTEANPTIIRSQIKWAAKIIGSTGHCIYIGDGCDWVIIDGFEVMGAQLDGIKTGADHIIVKNCWVHNNTQMGISLQSSDYSTIENNLIEFNGTHVQFHHGVYAYGVGLTIRNNIVRNNAGFGLHLYPVIKNSLITGNVIYNHKYKSGVLISCSGNLNEWNTFTNNTIANNQTGLSISAGLGEIVANNIFSNNISHTAFGTSTIIAENNLIFSQTTPAFGTNTIYADPLFVNSEKGVFWLKANSPAIGSGNALYLPATDFWGYAYPTGAKPYIGAFAYAEALTQDAFRANWHEGWAYNFADQEVPDFWNFTGADFDNVSVQITVPTPAMPDQTVVITVLYTNSGNTDTKDVVIRTLVPIKMEYVSGSAEASGGTWDAAANTISWPVGLLKAKQSGFKVYSAKVK